MHRISLFSRVGLSGSWRWIGRIPPATASAWIISSKNAFDSDILNLPRQTTRQSGLKIFNSSYPNARAPFLLKERTPADGESIKPSGVLRPTPVACVSMPPLENHQRP